MNEQKRVLAINDISCVGRCSLTVALPIISAAGIECSILPTAVLSTHTGGFKGFTLRDLNDDILPIANHWKKEDIKFDCIFSGYLASAGQIDNVISLVNMFKTNNNCLIVDPAMADYGKLYAGFDSTFPSFMAKLVSISDVTIPNITEACFLTGIPYVDGIQTKDYIYSLVTALTRLGAKQVVLTGVELEKDRLGVCVYDGSEMSFYFEDKLPYMYHGTGDVYSSVFVSCFAKGISLKDSAINATKVTVDTIRKTIPNCTDSKMGVRFEESIPYMINLLGGKCE